MPATTKTTTAPATRALAKGEVCEIAMDAYIYAYPLVLSELTRRSLTNVSAPSRERAPMNQFAHMPTFPDSSFANVVRPNADTLYSTLWFDVTREPLVVSVPDSNGRYYLLEMLDLWTDVFASPGARTTGTRAEQFCIAGPHWQGEPPAGTRLIRSPTGMGLIAGRTQTNGIADYSNVHELQHGMSAVPLGQFGKPYTPAQGRITDAWDTRTPPVAQIERLSGEAFFAIFTQCTRQNPPHANDYPVLHRMRRIGLEPGKVFSLSEAPVDVREAVENVGAAARKRIVDNAHRAGVLVNGWRTYLTGIGTYGADYLRRAGVAWFAWGANTVDDAVYPTAFTDADGKPLSSEERYLVHFDKQQIPPVRAFWSLTMYDHRQLFAANPIDRYAIGDRDPLRFNDDGSLDLYIQRESPGKDKESNWLPAPSSGPFTMNLRLYWPKSSVTDGTWSPPPVTCVG